MKKQTRHKLHQVYRLKDGTIVPGGSTIAGMIDKGFGMLRSAVKLTKEGLDYERVWADKADVGTIAHARILADLKGVKVNLDEYSPLLVKASDYCMESYFNWKSQHKVKALKCEEQFVSEKMKVGGTMDFIGEVDGVLALADYKTGGIYESAYIQTPGYMLIAAENGLDVKIGRILNFPRTKDDSFKDIILSPAEVVAYGDIFKKLCEIYWIKNALKKEG